jgi:hypothetical protein
MIQDVDATFKELLIADAGVNPKDIDISFHRPTRDWSSRLSRPTVNVFLYDIREREELKDDLPAISRNADGLAVKQKPPRRIDLVYQITAWTTEPDDEHRILSGILGCLYRHTKIEKKYLQGSLANVTYPVLARIPGQQETMRPNDLWGALDNEMRVAITWVITAPLDVFAPVSGPLVRSKEIQLGTLEKPKMENLAQVSAVLHQKGSTEKIISGARVSLQGTGFAAKTDAAGEFHFFNLPPGNYKLDVETPDGKTRTTAFNVPLPDYNVEV